VGWCLPLANQVDQEGQDQWRYLGILGLNPSTMFITAEVAM
jgi:hypothetical protein